MGLLSYQIKVFFFLTELNQNHSLNMKYRLYTNNLILHQVNNLNTIQVIFYAKFIL